MRYTELHKELGIDEDTFAFGEKIRESLKERFKEIDDNAEFCQLKVLNAMQKNNVSEACLSGTTGYGYNDLGRDTLEKVYADIFHTEDALVRPQITCGTHALALALMSNLRPGDELLSPVGRPYDTLTSVIGIDEDETQGAHKSGSLKEYGISYRQVDLIGKDQFDYEGIKAAINEKTRMVTIQRSKGYAVRESFSPEKIGELISFIRGIKPEVIIMVDNCYGEFVHDKEPSDYGADICVGSLIKNPGGGLCPCGGYLAGKKECIENAAYRLTSPGLGKEVGASLQTLRDFYQGLFLAPTVTASALKTSIYAAALYEALGFETVPHSDEQRNDIIQAITLGSREGICAFCEAVQSSSPVDAYVTPEPWDMPGYDDQVIMAAGAFVSGSSIELSADAPIREPYAVYFQGGLTFPHGAFGMLRTVQYMKDRGLAKLPSAK
ncbi:MAG: methionine gamma-lyase family protein [Lachnospiraceae bacterium]|nr:methionine gamma-lyase family protein [Lachnospiraceae bacterium]